MFGLKDCVEYIGLEPNLQKQYAGILEIWEIKESKYTCLKPNNTTTSWIEPADLRLVAKAKSID